MATRLSILPSDVLTNGILSFLDYESRINANRVLMPEDRMVKQFSKEKVLHHDIAVNASILKNTIDKIDKQNGLNKVTERLKIWREFCKKVLNFKLDSVIQASPFLYDILQKKLKEFSNIDMHKTNKVPIWLSKRIVSLTEDVFQYLHNIEKPKARITKVIQSIQVMESFKGVPSTPFL
jgi:hypothetical protein